jgi:uncharacterized protein HemY
MKKLMLFVILFFLLCLWGLGVILPDAGYVLIVLGQKTVETSLWFACCVLLSVCFVSWLVSRFFYFIRTSLQRIRDFFIKRD